MGNNKLIHDGIIRASYKIINSEAVSTLKDNVTQDELIKWLVEFVDRIKHLSMSGNTDNEPICQYTHRMECALFRDEPDTSSIPRVHNKPIIIWTGSEAMHAAMNDKEGICNLSVPITYLLYVLWKEIFCHAALNHFSRIPEDSDLHTVSNHPDVIDLKKQINQAKESLSLNEISRQFFGSNLSDDDIKLSETMGMFTSEFFVNRFSLSAPKAIFYFSNNKIDEYQHPVLPINTFAWDIELPVLRHKFGHNITFRSVHKGLVTEEKLDNVYIVRNRYHEDVLQDRRIYTCGRTSRPELLFYSSMQPRPTIAVSKMKQIINHWKNKTKA